MNKIKIPKSFQLGGLTVTVSYDKNLVEEMNALGLYQPGKMEIILQKPNKDYTEDLITKVYYHERQHAIFDIMGKNKLYKSERIVEMCAQFAYQADKTAKYKD